MERVSHIDLSTLYRKTKTKTNFNPSGILLFEWSSKGHMNALNWLN